MLFGGISTVILGALTGGWFGDIFKQIAEANPDSTVLGLPFRAADSITLLDPVQQIIYFLGIALFVGLIQLTTGVVVKAVHNISQGRPWAAVIDQLSWILFVWGVICLVPVGRLAPAWAEVPKLMIYSGMGLVVVGPALVQLFNWQGFRSFSLSFGGGLWSLYGMATGMMADVLSYSRLFALGLATGILATVIDILAVMIWGMAPVIGWLLAIVILVIGHVFNLLVQLLGAFIHSARLQFVEFFPKFFEGGGSVFQPFSRTLKNVYIQPEVKQES
jgi:V/A-type H+-transporting ATPase subunit I